MVWLLWPVCQKCQKYPEESVCTYSFNGAVKKEFYTFYLGVTFIYSAAAVWNVSCFTLVSHNNEKKIIKRQTEASTIHLSQISWIECNKEYKRHFFLLENNNNFLRLKCPRLNSRLCPLCPLHKVGKAAKLAIPQKLFWFLAIRMKPFSPHLVPQLKTKTNILCVTAARHISTSWEILKSYDSNLTDFLCDFSTQIWFTCFSPARSLVPRMCHNPPPGRRDWWASSCS